MTISIPTGVVTFLFSDVEASTSLWQSDPRGMAESLEVHDRIFRSVAEEFGGHVFSTAGDAFSIAFDEPRSSLDAAVELQRRLASTDWPGPSIRVRLGINTGTADERGGDYFGPAVNLAARVMSAGNGGQVLVSATTADLLSTAVADGVELFDHGAHRLPGFSEPQRILEVRHPDLTRTDGPLRTIELARHNLPPSLSSFIGRDAELESVGALLEQRRLVTLAGVGGTGKTRLATEVGRSLLGSFADGVWMVELAPIGRSDLVTQTVGEVFGLRAGEGASISDVVSRYLSDKELLLVIDNCEHVLDGAADTITSVLASPGVRVLATSRESLGVAGETVVRVPALDVADDRSSPAVRLFCDRAAAVDAPVAESELGAVASICRRVDGIPLGVELAAARVRSMSPTELSERIESSFRLLAAPAKSVDPRQRTLDATIDWSHELLDDRERAVFRRASVFAGGFDLPSAEEVVCGGEVEDIDVLDLLDSLIDKSLVLRVAGYGRTRYRMLEPVRQFAARMLEAAGERTTTLRAHAERFCAVATTAAPHLRGPEQIVWRDRLAVDIDNLRLAFDSLLEGGHIEEHLQLTFDLQMFWIYTGLHVEGIETGLRGVQVATEDIDPELRCKAWAAITILGAEITSEEAIGHGEAGLAIAEATGDPGLVGRMHMRLGAAIRHATTRPDYLDHLHIARDAMRTTEGGWWWEPEWERSMEQLLLTAYLPQSDPHISEHWEAAVTGFERCGDRVMLAASLSESASRWGSADPGSIESDLRRSVEILDGAGVPYWEAHARMIHGHILRLMGSIEEAAQEFDLAARPLDECGDVNCWASSTRSAAECESTMGMGSDAMARLPDILERFESLPMQDIHLPRLLDAVSRALEAAGRLEDSAVVFGAAVDTPWVTESILPRDELNAEQEIRLRAALGDRLDELLARGTGLSEAARRDLALGLLQAD